MALTMDLPEILSLCKVSKRFNNIVCENKNFWISKLLKDYKIEYNDIKSIFLDPKELYELIISEPDELLNIIMGFDKNIKQKDHLIGLAVENMFRIKNKLIYNNFPKNKQIYILYQTTYAFTEFKYYLSEKDAINNTLRIITELIDDDVYHLIENIIFEDFYGKPKEEYFDDIMNQIEQIKNKATVVIKVPTQDTDGNILEDTYVLHKFVKK